MLGSLLEELQRFVNSGFEFHATRSVGAIIAILFLSSVFGYIYLNTDRNQRRQHKHERIRKKQIQLVAATFDVDPHTGFLPSSLSHRLPSAFDAWETLMQRLPELNASGELHDAVHKLPRVAFDALSTDKSLLRRAHVMLSMLVQSYVNGATVPWYKSTLSAQQELRTHGLSKLVPAVDLKSKQENKLPAKLAEPFYYVCKELGFEQCMCSAATFDTWNWQLVRIFIFIRLKFLYPLNFDHVFSDILSDIC